MYQLLDLVVLAVEMYSPLLARVRVVLNPAGFTLPPASSYRVHLFVIARDLNDANQIALLFAGLCTCVCLACGEAPMVVSKPSQASSSIARCGLEYSL